MPLQPGGRTAIILGGSGSVGRALITEIVRSNHFLHVIVLTRRQLGPRVGANIEERLVTPMDAPRLIQAIVDSLREHGADAVGFSTLGVGAGTARLSLEEHRAIDVNLNAAFARGLKDSGRVIQLAFMSAMGADINAKTTGSGAPGMARYSRVKGEAEAAVCNQGLAVVSIFRPALIIGSQHTPRLLEIALSIFAPVTPANFRPIRATEIARAMVASVLPPLRASAIYSYPGMMALIAGAA